MHTNGQKYWWKWEQLLFYTISDKLYWWFIVGSSFLCFIFCPLVEPVYPTSVNVCVGFTSPSHPNSELSAIFMDRERKRNKVKTTKEPRLENVTSSLIVAPQMNILKHGPFYPFWPFLPADLFFNLLFLFLYVNECAKHKHPQWTVFGFSADVVEPSADVQQSLIGHFRCEVSCSPLLCAVVDIKWMIGG